MDKVQTINNLKVMAERGATQSERDTAQRLLEQLCEKYHVQLDDLSSEETQRYEFTLKSHSHRKLFGQIFWTLFGDRPLYRIKRSQKTFAYYATKAEHIDFSNMYEYYTGIFDKELAKFYSAFIAKYDLYNPDLVKQSTDDPDPGVAYMMAGITSKPYVKSGVRLIEVDD